MPEEWNWVSGVGQGSAFTVGGKGNSPSVSGHPASQTALEEAISAIRALALLVDEGTRSSLRQETDQLEAAATITNAPARKSLMARILTGARATILGIGATATAGTEILELTSAAAEKIEVLAQAING